MRKVESTGNPLYRWVRPPFLIALFLVLVIVGAPFIGGTHASGDLKIRRNFYLLGLALDRYAKEHEGRYPTSWEGLVQGFGPEEGHYDDLIQFDDPTTKARKRFILLVPPDGIVADDGILAQSPEYHHNRNSVVLVLKKGGRVESRIVQGGRRN